MDKTALIGTWRMISWTRTVVATGEVSDAMGPDPIGYIAYHADGRMMAFVTSRDRPKLNGKAPSDSEKAALFDTMLAYTAAYTLQEDRVIHHVEAAWNPTWERALVRPVHIEGNRLVISDAPGTDLMTGEDVIYRLEFQKL
ncbi:hypothetical protein FHX15_003633 [Rhizobium sp. BK650]|uniref:lipocalin-like domain-containing protein n=1 Tax=Rhizobium sp. BK650 TaxID=2586990 RepID=UPI001619B393|nr:lipocalin-like domain-containing protein [Rhizobium sp. BK650]MBB3658386.1 hypothetical protein [Rhizobium sp. BK650]